MNEFFSAMDDCLSAIEEIVGYVLKKVVFFFLVLILLCLTASLVNAIVTPHIPRVSGLETAASRLGFDPSLNDLAEYINISIKPGMSREEVEQILGKIGTIKVDRGEIDDIDGGWGPTACDYITLAIPDEVPGLGQVPGTKLKITACYDVEGHLVLMKPTYGSDAPPIHVSAP